MTYREILMDIVSSPYRPNEFDWMFLIALRTTFWFKPVDLAGQRIIWGQVREYLSEGLRGYLESRMQRIRPDLYREGLIDELPLESFYHLNRRASSAMMSHRKKRVSAGVSAWRLELLRAERAKSMALLKMQDDIGIEFPGDAGPSQRRWRPRGVILAAKAEDEDDTAETPTAPQGEAEDAPAEPTPDALSRPEDVIEETAEQHSILCNLWRKTGFRCCC